MTHTPLRPAQIPAAERARPAPAGRSKWPWITGAIVAVLAIGSGVYAISGGSSESAPAAPAASAAAVTRTAAEGGFSFVVSMPQCGVESVGPAELAQQPKGQFCLVDVSVENTGAEPALLDPGAQKLVDTQGREYPVADQAQVFLNDQVPSVLDEIKPGATVHGVLPFDVPAGALLSVLVLHESMGSRGARVPLS